MFLFARAQFHRSASCKDRFASYISKAGFSTRWSNYLAGYYCWSLLLGLALLPICAAQPPAGSSQSPAAILGVQPSERSALNALRSSLQFTPEQLSSLRWNTSTDPCGASDCTLNACQWRGIACNGGHVTDINISDNVVNITARLLSGQLPSELGSLSYLASLYANGHSIGGILPASWANLSRLQVMDLSDNALEGFLPPQWSAMQSLTSINVSGNRLVGSVPAAYASLPNLNSLDVRNTGVCASGANLESVLLQPSNNSCPGLQILAAQSPGSSPLSGPTPTPTPASAFNPNRAPILQMSTGINIAVSVVIGAFLLFGIIAGIIRVKRQQRAHQRWIAQRMVQLRQQEAQEEVAFRELIAKMTPPTVTLDASGRELTIAQADSQVLDQRGREWEATGSGSPALTADSLPDTSLSSSVLANDQSSARQASSGAPAGSPGESSPASSSHRVQTDQWQAWPNAGSLPSPQEQQYPLADHYSRQRIPPRSRKSPLFTVDIYITDVGSLTFDSKRPAPLDSFKHVPPRSARGEGLDTMNQPSMPALADTRMDDQALAAASPAPTPRTPDPERSSMRQEVQGPGHLGLEPSAASITAPLDANQVQARRRERIGRLRSGSRTEVNGDAPPAPLMRWPALRRLFGMESLEGREERLRRRADQIAQEEPSSQPSNTVNSQRQPSNTQRQV